ncbi:hypothetical protein VCR4J5_200223 [Vibrio crassostreae]|uniref:Uncharacterized protein n=1 Tax=Vibrio crassostreae TaxID=246167 RepID=A0ABM9QU91_9VIBR|nr:hypothetical protein VCR4J5_200223 [Vibrio crassostreae]
MKKELHNDTYFSYILNVGVRLVILGQNSPNHKLRFFDSTNNGAFLS